MGLERIFRTFLKGGGEDGKRCVDRHKGILQVRTFENASQFPSFGGVLKDGFVDISFDDAKMSKVFMDLAELKEWRCLVLANPDNGHIHTYWKDNKHRIQKFNKDLKLACGLVADIHGGETYIPLRCNGVDRFPPEYDVFENEDYQEIPDELIPVSTNINLWDSKEGDGRNSDLYAYILILQSQLQFSDDEIREMYKAVINPYILDTPLEDAELDVILREESFQQKLTPSFFSGTAFLFDKFADYVIKMNHIVRLNDQLHAYHEGVYQGGYKLIESLMIDVIPNLRKSQRREVLEYMELIAPVAVVSDPRYIAFKNGVYDIVDNQLHPFSPELIITNRIPWNYDPGAYDGLADITMDKLACKDPEIRSLLEECIGACFYRRNELAGGKAFILTGDKSNGKSTFLDLIKNVCGEDNISALDLSELGDRFNTSMMCGKLANIGDDIGDDFLQGSKVAIFKKIVTGNRIKAERKTKDPFEFNPYIKLLFSANDIPRMKDKTGAVLRRLVIIPFHAVFSKEDPDYDPEIKYKLCQKGATEYLIRIGMEGLKRVLVNKAFTHSEKVQKEIDEYEEENNPIVAFIADQGREMIENQPTAEVYKRYQVFCADNLMSPMSNIVFSKQINKRLGYKVSHTTINKRSIRIFRKGN